MYGEAYSPVTFLSVLKRLLTDPRFTSLDSVLQAKRMCMSTYTYVCMYVYMYAYVAIYVRICVWCKRV